MHSDARDRKRKRLRRVSKTGIFDGHPLKVSVYSVIVIVVSYSCITAAISLWFFYSHEINLFLVFWTLLPGALLGFFLLIMERWLVQLKEHMFPGMGKLLTAFLLFFAHIIGYLTLSSLVFSYPLGLVIEKYWSTPGMAGEYSLFSVNFFIVLAILSWLRNVRTDPCRCL
jgi:hypothetical protein